MAKKKGKKGKKGKKKAEGPPPVTTQFHIEERTKMFAPRLGDLLLRTMRTEEVLDDCSLQAFIRSASRKLNTLNASSYKMRTLPDISYLLPELKHIQDINLSKNQLFNADEIFQVSFFILSFFQYFD
jgi:hypothetical protein